MHHLQTWNPEALGLASKAVLLGLSVAAAGLLLAVIPLGAELEQDIGLAWLFAARGPLAPPRDVVVIAIDERSARDLGLQDRPSTWPRALHAELVRHLELAGARVVSFDLIFDAPGVKPEQDQVFADAIRSAGNVLLAESIRRDTLRIQGADATSSASAVIESRALPIAVLHDAARGSAPFMLPKESRVDTYWTSLDDPGATPTLPVLAFQVFADAALPPATRPAPVPSAKGPPSDRTLLGRYASGESRYLNFYGPPRTISTVSYSDVLSAARAPSPAPDARAGDALYKDKAVFIGYAAATPAGQDRLRDDYRTVYSGANRLDLSGVEIAATAFGNLVEDRVIRPAGLPWHLAIVIVWGLALGSACRLARPVFAAFLVVAASAAYGAVALERFADAALWLPLIIPLGLQTSLALFAGVWLRYRDTKREREGIKRAFGYFLPQNVVDQLSRNLGPMTRANQVLFGACLATDAEKYTTLAEQTEPGRLGELMNEYYAHLFVPVERSRGVVADIVGDSMVAVWARTSPDTDVRRSACQATLDIVASLDGVNGSGGGDSPSMRTRFGIHSGDMLFGNIGASGHYEYRAVGDIVNTASRIQGLNKVLDTRILASAQTVQGLDGFVVRPVGSFLLAGKAHAVSVVELLGRRGERDDTGTDRALCGDFALGLQAFCERRWNEAQAAFAHVLQNHPGDGPSRFYATRCEQLQRDPPGEEWSPTLRIDSK